MIDTDAVERRSPTVAMSTWAVVAVVIVATVGAVGGVAAAGPSASPDAPNATTSPNASATPPGAVISSAIAVQEARTSQSYREALIEEDLDRADSPADRERVRRAHLAALERDARSLSMQWNRTRGAYASGAVPASVYRVKMTGSAARANALHSLVERSAVDDAESERILRELPETGGSSDLDRPGDGRSEIDRSDRSPSDGQSSPTNASDRSARPDRGVETASDDPWSDDWPAPWADGWDDRFETDRPTETGDQVGTSDDADSVDRTHEYRGSPPVEGWGGDFEADDEGVGPDEIESPWNDSEEGETRGPVPSADDHDDGTDDGDEPAWVPSGAPSEDPADAETDRPAGDEPDTDDEFGAAPDTDESDDRETRDTDASDEAESDDESDRGTDDGAGDWGDDTDESPEWPPDPDEDESDPDDPAHDGPPDDVSGDPGVEELHPELADRRVNETA